MILLVFDTKEECDKFVVLYEKYYKVVLYIRFDVLSKINLSKRIYCRRYT